MFTQKFQAWVRRWAERGIGIFRDSPITPNMLTLFGLLITGVGAALVAVNQLLLGGLVLMVAGCFDIFDGALARASGKVYRYGAFLDSTVDRYSEGVVYLGILIYFLQQHDGLRPILVLIALAGSFLVARPVLKDPSFRQTVVLLLQHGAAGAFGLVVNRQATVEGLPFPVFVGGPCEAQGWRLAPTSPPCSESGSSGSRTGLSCGPCAGRTQPPAAWTIRSSPNRFGRRCGAFSKTSARPSRP